MGNVIDPPELPGRPSRPGASRRYSQGELEQIVQARLREQAESFAFADLKEQVDRLAQIVPELRSMVDQQNREREALGRHVEEHIEAPMHKGTRQLLDEFGVNELSPEQRGLLKPLLSAADHREAGRRARTEFWTSWQLRTAVLATVLGTIFGAVWIVVRFTQ